MADDVNVSKLLADLKFGNVISEAQEVSRRLPGEVFAIVAVEAAERGINEQVLKEQQVVNDDEMAGDEKMAARKSFASVAGGVSMSPKKGSEKRKGLPGFANRELENLRKLYRGGLENLKMEFSVIIIGDPAGKPYVTVNIRDALVEVVDLADLVAVGTLRNNNVFQVVFKDQNTKQAFKCAAGEVIKLAGHDAVVFDLYSKFAKARLHWVPWEVTEEEVGCALSYFGPLVSYKGERNVVSGMGHLFTTVRDVTIKLRDGMAINDLPEVIGMNGNPVLMMVEGRQPRCLRCGMRGHVRKRCSSRYCSQCAGFFSVVNLCQHLRWPVVAAPATCEEVGGRRVESTGWKSLSEFPPLVMPEARRSDHPAPADGGAVADATFQSARGPKRKRARRLSVDSPAAPSPKLLSLSSQCVSENPFSALSDGVQMEEDAEESVVAQVQEAGAGQVVVGKPKRESKSKAKLDHDYVSEFPVSSSGVDDFGDQALQECGPVDKPKEAVFLGVEEIVESPVTICEEVAVQSGLDVVCKVSLSPDTVLGKVEQSGEREPTGIGVVNVSAIDVGLVEVEVGEWGDCDCVVARGSQEGVG